MKYAKAVGRKPLNKERIQVKLPKGMAKQLMDVAMSMGKDRSDLIADIAREYLAKHAARSKHKK